MVNKRQVLILLALSLFFGISVFLIERNANEPHPSACSNTNALFCFSDTAEKIAQTNGITEALVYVEETVAPQSVYHIAHLVLHEVGQEAYTRDGDIHQALARLEEYLGAPRFDFMWDGYRHGVFQGYLSDLQTRSNDPDPLNTLVTTGCSFYENEGTDPAVRDQCYHGIGHALMFVADNDIKRAVSGCSTLPDEASVLWCNYGAFMEQSYLVWNRWNEELPRDEALGDPKIAFLRSCNAIAPEAKDACYRLLGRALYATTPTNPRPALKACSELPTRYFQSVCTLETSAIAIPATSNTEEEMLAHCRALPESLYGICIYGTSAGIIQGSGSFTKRDNTTFCELADSQFYESCMSATGRDYTVLY